jgi:hypothetical protein
MTTAAIHIIGIDLGKNWFHLVGMNERAMCCFARNSTVTSLPNLLQRLRLALLRWNLAQDPNTGAPIPERWLYRTHHSGPIR